MGIFYYFFITLAIELPFVIYFFRKDWKKAFVIGILLNAFTWPLLQLSIQYFDVKWVPLLELLISITEGVGYYIFLRIKLSHSILLSLLVNGLSYGIGILIQ